MEEETHEDKVLRALKSQNVALSYLSEMSCRGKGGNMLHSARLSLPYSFGFSHSVWPAKQNGEKVSWISALRF